MRILPRICKLGMFLLLSLLVWLVDLSQLPEPSSLLPVLQHGFFIETSVFQKKSAPSWPLHGMQLPSENMTCSAVTSFPEAAGQYLLLHVLFCGLQRNLSFGINSTSFTVLDCAVASHFLPCSPCHVTFCPLSLLSEALSAWLMGCSLACSGCGMEPAVSSTGQLLTSHGDTSGTATKILPCKPNIGGQARFYTVNQHCCFCNAALDCRAPSRISNGFVVLLNFHGVHM